MAGPVLLHHTFSAAQRADMVANDRVTRRTAELAELRRDWQDRAGAYRVFFDHGLYQARRLHGDGYLKDETAAGLDQQLREDSGRVEFR